MAKRIGNEPGWVALSEDEFWNRLPREPHTFRTDVEKAIVQGMVADAAIEHLERGERVAIEFIVYEDPPQPIQFYASILAVAGYKVWYSSTYTCMPVYDTAPQLQRWLAGFC